MVKCKNSTTRSGGGKTSAGSFAAWKSTTCGSTKRSASGRSTCDSPGFTDHLVILVDSALFARVWHWQPPVAEQVGPSAESPGPAWQQSPQCPDPAWLQQRLDSTWLSHRLPISQLLLQHAVLTVPSTQTHPAVGRPASIASGSISHRSGFRSYLAREWSIDGILKSGPCSVR